MNFKLWVWSMNNYNDTHLQYYNNSIKVIYLLIYLLFSFHSFAWFSILHLFWPIFYVGIKMVPHYVPQVCFIRWQWGQFYSKVVPLVIFRNKMISKHYGQVAWWPLTHKDLSGSDRASCSPWRICGHDSQFSASSTVAIWDSFFKASCRLWNQANK